MARVYRGFDERLERPVAIKILGDSPVSDRSRFEAEVRILARLDHPDLVRILDAGTDGGDEYLIMDLVEGGNLALRSAKGAMTSAKVAAIGACVAAALAYVHGKGVVHRDIKPANILLTPEGQPLLADFGVARALDSAGLTLTGHAIGTPAYLAPEQVTNREVGPPADIYALGLVLIECLTGAPVFQGHPAEVAAVRLHSDPDVPGTVSTGWRILLRSMTARLPANRPTAGEVAAYLEALAESELGSVDGGKVALPVLPTLVLDDAVLPSSGVPTNQLPTTAESRLSPVVNRRGRRILPVALAALLVGLLLGRLVLSPSSAASLSHRHRGASVTHKRARNSSPPASNSTTTTASASSTTTTTTAPRPTLSSTAASLVSVLATGERNGAVTPQAGQDILSHLQQLLFPLGGQLQQTVQLYQQLLDSFYQDVSDGDITGSAVEPVSAAIVSIGHLLSVPATTTQPSGGSSGNHGHHHHHGGGD